MWWPHCFLTQTFPLSPLQTPHSHPLWWSFLLLPWLKTGFSLKTSFFWSCSRLTHPVLQIRKLCVLLILVSYTVGKNPCSYEVHTTWLCYTYPPLLSVYEPFITWAQSSSLLRNIMPSLWHAIIIPDNPCHKYWPGFPHLQLCFKRFLSFPLSRIISEYNLLMVSSLLQPPSLMVTLVIFFNWLSSETINLGNPPDNHYYPSTKFHWI